MNYMFLYLTSGAGALALLFAFWRSIWIHRQEPGGEQQQEIGSFIRSGAMAFLAREYKILAVYILCVAVLLVFGNRASIRLIVVSFVVGALFSGLAGYIGMRAATEANTRTAHGAIESLQRALRIAFSGGSVMGMTVVGLGILGLSGLMTVYVKIYGSSIDVLRDTVIPIISGYSLGASSVALFARVGGGIFTKAVDVGADLVGKVEAGIPEDDPRNPATIADNVGDNVGDVAGLGSDLCESYVATITGAVVLGGATGSIQLVFLPLILAGFGVVISMIGTLFVRMRKEGNPRMALNLGTIGSAVMMILLSFPVVIHLSPQQFTHAGHTYSQVGIFWSLAGGLVGGVLIGILTEYYTSERRKPTRRIAQASTTGAAANIISGIETGMISTALPVIMLALLIMVAHTLAGLYGIAVAALGMLATTGIQLAVDAYRPIADNAGGIAEMTRMDHRVRERTDRLDAVGNTTAAIGKGFAIGSAALTALALFVAYEETVGLRAIDVTRPQVIACILFGGMLPFLFSSLVIGSVGKTAFHMIEEVRRQFREIPELLEGKAKADYVRCVDIATGSAIKNMIIPGVLAVAIPLGVGLLGDAEMLGGVLVGCIICGVMLALFMATSGGAWDNAKKHIENGAYGGKGSAAHRAAVIGDTVGDPFKDTASPSMDILIKIMSVVSLIIAPIIR
jgi:K(+)-stimulated pyrophosphate-energized sodium pump